MWTDGVERVGALPDTSGEWGWRDTGDVVLAMSDEHTQGET